MASSGCWVMDENICARPSGHCLVQNDHRKAECTHRHHCNLRYHFSNVVRSGIGKNVFEHALELFHVLKTILLFLVLKITQMAIMYGCH